jgi:hypothetical protein
MGKLIMKSAAVAAISGALSFMALAGNPPGTGQPNQECEGTTPGRSASAPGSAFNENGKAGTVYANPTSQGGISSGNSHVVSQYDVACYQQSVKPSSGKTKP